MARLIVVAASEDTKAAPGNREYNWVVVSVTDVNGVPVTGLAASNFKIFPIIVGPGGSLVNITEAFAHGLPGCYVIKVVPIPAGTWKAGTYIFVVAVERSGDQGQTMASVFMD
jgi:hypothetical protein